MKIKRIVVTGGHPTPALAVIDTIVAERPNWEIYFIGVKHPLTGDKALAYEFKELQQRGIDFFNIYTGKLSRQLTLAGFLQLLRLPLGLIQSIFLLAKIRPHLVLTFGGYVALPVAVAAYLLRIPIVTHEQSLRIGLANRIIAKLADKILLSWPVTKGVEQGAKVVITGVPLRKAIESVQEPEYIDQLQGIDKPLLYITGGSQGAHFINSLVELTLSDLLTEFVVIHQVGESTKYNDLERMKRLAQPGYIPQAHILSCEIGWILQNAQLVVTRAGMNTICELLYLKKKALIIPLPKAINPEQTDNASLYQRAQLGKVVQQEEITADKFVQILKSLLKQRQQASGVPKTKIEGLQLQSPQAAKRILAQINELVES